MTKQSEIINDPKYISVLDHGFVGLVEHMGNDASIAQSARVSYGEGTKKVNEDRNLIRYLIRHKHTSPLEMVEFRFHVKMPIFVARQWVRHRTANINEYSGRYSVMSDEFYTPDLGRIQPQSKTNNQGSSGSLSDNEANFAQSIMRDNSSNCLDSYRLLLNEYSVSKIESDVYFTGENEERQGVSRELSRIVLPVSNYTEMYWKLDLHNLFHFLNLRLDSHAQWEIQAYGEAIYNLIKPIVPISCEAFEDYIRNQNNFSKIENNLLLEFLKSNLSPKETFEVLVFSAGSEDALAKKYGLSRREWTEFKKKTCLNEIKLDLTKTFNLS
jgi:thymidylate synthase (FAD)